MQKELGKNLTTLQRCDKISLVIAGLIVDGTFEEVVENCVVLSDAHPLPAIKKKHYSLRLPAHSIYA